MCGITGIHGKADSDTWAAAHSMTAALAHRGPDASKIKNKKRELEVK
jgi:asparagine synthetase B (glutamine-hydrolysing)